MSFMRRVRGAADAINPVRSSNIEMASIGNDNKIIEINIGGLKKEVHQVSNDEVLIPIQELCAKLLYEYFPTEEIGPAAVQLFGIASFDSSKKVCTWLNPKKTLTELKRCNFKGLNNLLLRIRFLPIKEKVEQQYFQILSNSRIPNPSHVNFLIKFLFFQWQDDFVTDRLNVFYDELVLSGKARGIAVLDLLIMARLLCLDPVETIFGKIESIYHSSKKRTHANFWENYHILPKRECFNFWKRYKLKKNMRTKLIAYSEEYPVDKISCEELMLQYIREIMLEVTERYVAKEVNSEMKVEITINIPNGCGVCIREMSDHSAPVMFSTIENLQSASIQYVSYENNKSWNVHINRTNGKPQVLCFDSQESAESFLSGLDGYYRLIHNYYFSLCDQVEPPSVKQLSSIKCHGPIEDRFAVNKLKTSYSEHEYYILKQDIYKKDKYAIIYSKESQIKIKCINKENGKFFLDDDRNSSFDSLTLLLKSLSGTGNTLPPNPFRVRPKSECCEVLRNLFLPSSELIPTEDEDSVVTPKKRQPIVFVHSDVKVIQDEKLGTGYFTEIYKGHIRGIDKMVAVKQIRQHGADGKNQEFRCYESLQNGACQQLGFDDIKFFVGIHGINLSSPPQLIEEYAQYGSLINFFTLGKSMTLQHFMYIAIQLAEALLYMDEKNMCHGSICCKNILVFKHDDGDIHIKLGDTGMLSIYNKLPISHILNVYRLPWIAPELFSNLSKTTIATDVYAFSTTLWECASTGRSPLCINPLKDFGTDSNKIMEFYQKGNMIEFPEELLVKDHNDTEKEKVNKIKKVITDIMVECWDKKEKRLETNNILKGLRTVHNDYMYHGYNREYSEINEEEMDTSLTTTNNDIGQSQTSFEEIPNIVKIIECHDRGDKQKHLPAEEMRVKLPPQKFINVQQTNRSKILMDVLSSDIHSRRMSKQIGFKFIIDSKRLRLNKNGNLGAGHYGEVKQGYLTNSVSEHSKGKQKIAVKILKSDHYKGVLESDEFRHEAEVMSKLEHPNIVKFIGISDNMLVMEFVEMGCMRDYLRKKKKADGPLSTYKLLQMCTDIAAGMAYLAMERILHCDLAARNVLLNSHLTAKISDFGLAKILDKDKDYYRVSSDKQLPAWWCSPEALGHKKFSSKADVWSYGIVMWEGFTHSKPPKLVGEIKYLLSEMDKGKRLSKPDQCPLDVYSLMRHCWEKEPDNRPDFVAIEKRCSEFCILYQEDKDVKDSSSDSTSASQSSSDDGKSPVSLPSPVDVESNQLSHQTDMTSNHSESQRPLSDSAIQSNEPKTDKQCSENTINKEHATNHNLCLASNTKEKIPNKDIGQNCAEQTQTRHVPTDDQHQQNINETPMSTGPGTSTQSGDGIQQTPGCLVSPLSAYPLCRVKGTPLPALPCPLDYLLERKHVIYDDRESPLGAGNFGIVYQGTFVKNGQSSVVAIKTLREDQINGKDEIEAEVKILGDLEHPNIVKFYGYCRTSCLLVMELVDNGSLLKYLQKCRHENTDLSEKHLTLCLGVAQGMEYLVSKNIIHCDLAARNVLLTKNLTTKISDFGLSKLLQEKAYYRRSGDKLMNPNWCAPEFCAKRMLSSASDVWSYGIVMWEIFSGGKEPNICKTDIVLKDIAMHIIEKGCRLEKPEKCSDSVYQLMQDCWKMAPERRPDFTGLVKQLQSC